MGMTAGGYRPYRRSATASLSEHLGLLSGRNQQYAGAELEARE